MKKKLLLFLLLAVGTNMQAQEYLMVADQMPKFGKNGYNSIKKYIDDHADYPPQAYFNKIDGEVNIRFVIKDDARMVLMSPAYMKTLGYGLEESAMKAISSMPAWTPGVQDGKKVNVWVFLPYSFKLPSEMPYFSESYLNVKATYPGGNFKLLQFFQDSCGIKDFNGIDAVKPVLIDLHVDTTGRVTKATINEKDESNPLLHKYAIETALKLEGFDPAQYKGKKVRSVKTFAVGYNKPEEVEIEIIEEIIVPEEIDRSEIIEIPAEYPGGFDAMITFIIKQIEYPLEALDSNKSGTVFIEMLVKEDGSIDSIRPKLPKERQLGYGMEEEAMRVISLMPNWIPAKKGKKRDLQNVVQRFTIPISFELDLDEPKKKSKKRRKR